MVVKESTVFCPLQVYCRIRPLDVAEKCVKMLDDQTVQFSPCDVSNLSVSLSLSVCLHDKQHTVYVCFLLGFIDKDSSRGKQTECNPLFCSI